MKNLKKTTLEEEISRFRSINKYKLLSEQEETLPPAEGDPTGDEVADPSMDTPLPPAEGDPMGDETMGDETMGDDMGDSTEEIDITDLVNMTKSIKNDLDDRKKEELSKQSNMDNVFTKLDDFENSLRKIDTLLNRIDSLEDKVEVMKEPTPVEKLEMRSLDSYPFNTNSTDFFQTKQEEMRKSGKNEYVLTKSDIENYSPDQIVKSFNPDDEVDI